MLNFAKKKNILMRKKLLGICLILTSPSLLFSQIAAWDFTGESNVSTSTAEVYNTNLDASSSITRGAGALPSAGANSFRTTGFQNNGIALTNTDYFENTFSAAPGFTLSLTSINARFAGTGTFIVTPGVSMQYAYSLDGTNFTLIGSPTIMTATGAMPTIDLSGISAIQNVTDDITVTIRFYASGQTTTGGWGYNSPSLGSYGLAFGGTLNCIVQSTFYADTDADGFGDLNSTIQACDAPAGYVSNSTDCDDTNPLLNPNTIWYLDADNDTFGDLTNPFTGCTPPTNATYVLNSTDCDDTNPNFNAVTTWYLDSDSDGFGNLSMTTQNCGQPVGYVADSTDCDDSNNQINPNATEVFDGVDNNCDSVIDEGFTFTTYYEDLDNDGFGSSISIQSVTNPGAGYSLVSGDCDDNNNLINPNAIEICDGIDNNCDLNIDENLPTFTYYLDADNDGFGDLNFTIIDCSVPVGYSTNSLDCDDTNSLINPGATDIPGNGIDEDCDGVDAPVEAAQLGLYEFTQASACPVLANTVTLQPTNANFSIYSNQGGTCTPAANVFNNNNWSVGSTVNLNNYNEFSIQADQCFVLSLTKLAFTHKVSNVNTIPTWHLRSNVDNYASDIASDSITSNVILVDTVLLGLTFSNINQVTFRFYITGISTTGATWRNDNVGLWGSINTVQPQTFYADTDNDGFGDLAVDSLSCLIPVGFVLDSTDCNDADSLINPTTVWFLDADLDTFGDATNSVVSCTQPIGYVFNNTDCNDNDNQITGAIMYYVDADGDGFGDDATGVEQCSQPQNTVTISGDCDDTNDQIYPGAIEICDGIDNNCTGGIDEGLTFITYFTDADNDGFGIGTGESLCSNPGTGFAVVGGDCNDNNDQIYPGAIEILDNSIDENCDGVDGYLSVEDLTFTTFKIVPNPNNGTFVIELNTVVSNATVTIQDINGKAVQNSIFTGSTFEVSLFSLTPGIYFVKIQSENSIAIDRMVIR